MVSNSTPRYGPKRNRDTCIPILKGAQEPNNGNTPVSISGQMDKQNIADIQWNTSLIKEGYFDTCHNMAKS